MQTNIQRQLKMLELIPRHPRRITANRITEHLKDLNFDVGLRTVQRELKAMYEMGLFGLEMDDRCKPFGWSVAACWQGMNLTLMDRHVALAFFTLKHNARQLLPPDSLKQLAPYFDRADQVLGSDSDRSWLYWACRVAQLPEPLPLMLIEQDPQVLATVQEALLQKRQIACQLKRFIKGEVHWVDYSPINLQGIKISDGVALLVFTIGSFHTKLYARPIDSVRHVRLLDTPVMTRENFADALHDGVRQPEWINIDLLFSPSANFILRQAKLAADQHIERLDDGRYRVQAKVKDTPRLRAFLWEMADSVEVVAPPKLRAHFSRLAIKLNQQYQTAATEFVAVAG